MLAAPDVRAGANSASARTCRADRRIPSALFLAAKASRGAFDASFYSVRALELLAGAVNLMLLGFNMRDGLRITGKRARPGASVHNQN